MADSKRAGHRMLERGEAAQSNTYYKMSEIYGKHRKRYLDYPNGKSKPTYIIHGPSSSRDEYKILGYFGSVKIKMSPTKDRGHDTVLRNKLNRQKDNIAIVNSAVDEILFHGNQKVSAEKESHKNNESDFDENKLHQIKRMSLYDT